MGIEQSSLHEGNTTPDYRAHLSVDDANVIHVHIGRAHFTRNLREIPIAKTDHRLFSRENIVSIVRDLIARGEWTIIEDCTHASRDDQSHRGCDITESDQVQRDDAHSYVVIHFATRAQIGSTNRYVYDAIDISCMRVNDPSSQSREVRNPGDIDLGHIVTEKIAQFTNFARIWSESHAFARDVAMQQHFANAERRFGRITPAQETFARRLFSAEIDGAPIVFEAARSFGVHEDRAHEDRAHIPILPLYARAVTRYVNGHYTCLCSLAHVSCYRLIFTGCATCDCHDCTGVTNDIPRREGVIRRYHDRWHPQARHTHRLPHCELLKTDAREIIITIAMRVETQSSPERPLQRLELATDSARGIGSMITCTAQECPEVFTRARLVIDTRAGIQHSESSVQDAHEAFRALYGDQILANVREANIAAIAHAKYEDLSVRDLLDYKLSDEYTALRKSARDNVARMDMAAILRECGDMTFDQWFNI